MIDFNGIRFIERENLTAIPKLQLSPDIDVDPEFRKKCNAWYVEMFGHLSDPIFMIKNAREHGFDADRVAITTPAGLKKIKKAIAKQRGITL